MGIKMEVISIIVMFMFGNMNDKDIKKEAFERWSLRAKEKWTK